MTALAVAALIGAAPLRVTRDRGFSTPAYAGRMRADIRFHLRRTGVRRG